jgi:maltooligosyltrehalose trehalohydrolase
MTFLPSLGAWLTDGGVRFRVWAPDHERVDVRIGAESDYRLSREAGGYHAGLLPVIGAGARYKYVLDAGDAFPDPASRFQPEGVHGPSEVIDASAFEWTDDAWPGLQLESLVVYQLHIGTWTRAGTFVSATEALPRLAELGVTAVQLLPIADFAGDRNWGYDGVSLFAPARCYGRPDDLRAFVDRAHALGLGVLLDVVYNHFGPDGAYHGTFSEHYFAEHHRSPWGAGINLDGDGSEAVRRFFIESALHWLHEYHVDGFRLDATARLVDDSSRHFMLEYTETIQNVAMRERPPLVIAEDHRNLAALLHSRDQGGYGIDAVLADDFHHEVRRAIAGDNEGYYQDYAGSAGNVARALRQGWLYTGQHSAYWNEHRGTDPTGVALPRFVHCIQNHDQVGNRAEGDRLPATAGQPATRAATALLLCSAATPLLFMGQEWAASSPFLFFTDHHEELGRAVTDGRRSEFSAWSEYADPKLWERIPDPQALSTFTASRLRWEEREREPHASMLRLTGELLRLRRTEPALVWADGVMQDAFPIDDDTVALTRECGDEAVVLIAKLRGGPSAVHVEPGGALRVVLTTEDDDYTADPMPIAINADDGAVQIAFERPGAVLLRGRVASRDE